MSSNPPTWSRALIPDNEEFVDDSYNREELEAMGGKELQSLAAKHPTDEVNGHSTADDVVDSLEGKKRV